MPFFVSNLRVPGYLGFLGFLGFFGDCQNSPHIVCEMPNKFKLLCPSICRFGAG